MIRWQDGVEHHGDTPLREIVQPNVWSSSVWISQDGEAYRKYYNPVARTWGEWEGIPVSLDQERGARLGYSLPTGWKSIEACIATAWLHRDPGSRCHTRITDLPPNARNISWGEGETDSESGDFSGERWKSLKWHCGQVECDPRYRISSHGRLKNPEGVVTRGFSAHGTRWAAVRGCGLVNLLAASGLARDDVPVPPRVYRAYVSLSSGLSPEEHAERWKISERASWQYFCVAAPLVQGLSALGRGIVSPGLWDALDSLKGDPLLGGKLTDLHAEVSSRIGDVSMEELRFARTCVVSD